MGAAGREIARFSHTGLITDVWQCPKYASKNFFWNVSIVFQDTLFWTFPFGRYILTNILKTFGYSQGHIQSNHIQILTCCDKIARSCDLFIFVRCLLFLIVLTKFHHQMFCDLTLSWHRFLSHRNQSIDFQNKSIDWSLYDSGLRHERVNRYIQNKIDTTAWANIHHNDSLAGNYMFKVNNRNTRIRFEISSKLTIKIPERRHWHRSGIFIINFKHISHLVLVVL